jgi:radical SAM protein with 4Fe4S-binding SPASM domain
MSSTTASRALNYRFVWNKEIDRCSITSAYTGYDAVLNGGAALILSDLSKDPTLIEEYLPTQSDFLAQAMGYGWIDRKGNLQGAFTEIEGGPHLRRMQMELTTQCNLKCSYCYSESGPTKKSKLTIDEVRTTLEQARDLGLTWIDFTGGEFFLFQNWQEALEIARSLGLVVTLHTNGTPLTLKNLSIVQEHGIRCLQISLDSHIAELHDSVRGIPGSFEKSIAGIRMAKKMKLPVRVCIMVHQKNKDTVRDTIKWFRDELNVSLMLDRVIPTGGELDAKLGLDTKEYFELIAPLVGRDVEATRICENKGTRNHSNIEPHCGVAQSFVYLTADGEFALCPTMTSRDRDFFEGPSIRDTDLKTAWLKSDYFNNYRYTNCKNVGVCPAAQKCGGGCRSNAYFETGEVDSPDFFSCNIYKNPTVEYVDFGKRYKEGVFGVS